jgi:hypothetical protein
MLGSWRVGEGLRLVKIQAIDSGIVGHDPAGDERAIRLPPVADVAVGQDRPEKSQAQFVQIGRELSAVGLFGGIGARQKKNIRIHRHRRVDAKEVVGEGIAGIRQPAPDDGIVLRRFFPRRAADGTEPSVNSGVLKTPTMFVAKRIVAAGGVNVPWPMKYPGAMVVVE